MSDPCIELTSWSAIVDATEPPFRVSVSYRTSGVTVLSVVGALDMTTCPDLEQHLESQLHRPGFRRLVVDLQRTSFLSAQGVSCLLHARELAERRGLELRLVINNRPVATPFDLLHLRAKFKINETLSGACSNLGRS